MISQTQFGSQSSSVSNQTMPSTPKYDGPATLKTPEPQGVMSANSGVKIPKPGFS